MESTMGRATPASGNGTASFLERMAERMGVSAKASVIYGEPIERAGVTVVTVAKARWGVGGGSGGQEGHGEGTGGGGGVMVSPIGYIEIRDGSSTFKPIYDPMAILTMVLGSGLAALLLLRGLRKLVR
jgi:uncharacterized spore protein YtfJ